MTGYGRLLPWLANQYGDKERCTCRDAKDRYQADANSKQLPNTTKDKKCPDHEPERLNLQGHVFPRYLLTNHEDPNTEETYTPIDIQEERNSYPYKKEPPCNSFQLLRRDSTVDHRSNRMVCHDYLLALLFQIPLPVYRPTRVLRQREREHALIAKDLCSFSYRTFAPRCIMTIKIEVVPILIGLRNGTIPETKSGTYAQEHRSEDSHGNDPANRDGVSPIRSRQRRRCFLQRDLQKQRDSEVTCVT